MTEQMKLPHDHHGDASLEAHLIETLHAAGDFSMAANVFKQLSDSSRLRIFWLLCHCEQCVVNISSMVEMVLDWSPDFLPSGIAPSAPASPERAD